MIKLKGNNISLRAIEPEDLDFLYTTENNEDFWEVSHTLAPFSKYNLKNYIANSHLDIYEAKQLRLIIVENTTNTSVGMIDLFDFEPHHKRAGIGILITKPFQGKKYAFESLDILIKYAFEYLGLHQLYANILIDNTKSIELFKKQQFQQVGIKKDWVYRKGNYKDELLLQLINEK